MVLNVSIDYICFPVIALFVIHLCEEVSSYACKSPSGNEVDWYVAYKLPDLGPRGDGTAFLYADSTNRNWQLSDKSIEDTQSSVGLTVSQIFSAKRNKNDFFALYNDENPNTGKTDSNRAHMKGVLVFNDISGFWMIHSVPKFPLSNGNKYVYPETGKRNGQSLMCITLSSTALQEIGKQLFVAQPNVYDAQLPNLFVRLFPDLANVVNRKSYPKKKPFYSIIEIHSLNGQKFTTFFKNKKYGKDLYLDLVAPILKTSLYVETWLVGRGDLPSECGNYEVRNVLTVKPSNIAFKSTEDHSKWAVSETGDWVCIGDINRQKSQEHRGGGTICLPDVNIASLYQSAVNDVESCT